jgi:Fur family ferric uptake transcriptional regulator
MPELDNLVCEGCGRLSPFADRSLERAIDLVSRRAEFEVAGHVVVLRGRCPDCQKAA